MSLTLCYGPTFTLLSIRVLVFRCVSHVFYRKSEQVLYYGIKYSHVCKTCVSWYVARCSYNIDVL